MRVAMCLVVALLAVPSSASAAAVETKSLRRIHDPVIVTTSRIAAFPTRTTDSFRLYRFERGAPIPIPHQFDARDAQGDVIVGGPADFEFDSDDELVFMAADTGDRAAPEAWPEDWDRAVEIEVIDPRPGKGGRGWAYLAWFRLPPPPPAFEPYVTIEPDARRVRAASYQVEYAADRNYFTAIRLVDASGSPRENLLRQSRMRGSPTFSLFFKQITLDFTEQNSIIELDGVRAGPVRAIRRARLKIDLGALFPDLPGGTAYTFHYRSAYLTPSRVGFSALLLRALREFRFENVLEFPATVLPVRYFDRTRPDGVVAAATGAELRSTDDHEWWAHSSDAGTMLHALVIPERWRAWGVARGTLVRPAADAPGTAMGYTLEHMTRLREAGTWDLAQVSVVLPRPYQPGDEDDPLALVREPLRTQVRWLERTGEAQASRSTTE